MANPPLLTLVPLEDETPSWVEALSSADVEVLHPVTDGKELALRLSAGIQQARGRWLSFVRTQTQPGPDWPDACVQALERDPETKLCVPFLPQDDGPFQSMRLARSPLLRDFFQHALPFVLEGALLDTKALRQLGDLDRRLFFLSEASVFIRLLMEHPALICSSFVMKPQPTSTRTPEDLLLLTFEAFLVREPYLTFTNHDTFLDVFPTIQEIWPRVRTMKRRWTTETALFCLFTSTLQTERDNRPLMLFCYHHLQQRMGSDSFRSMAAKEFDFHLKDYFNLLENVDVFGHFGPLLKDL